MMLDAGFRFAAEDSPLDWGRAAVFGQQRAVEVDAAEASCGECFGTEDFAVVADHEQVGGEGSQFVLALRGN